MASDTTNRLRIVRRQAKSLGLRMTQRGDHLVFFDAAGERVQAGTLDFLEAYLAERYVRRRPGPARSPAPGDWGPWIDVFVSEQRAARRRPASTRLRIMHLNALARAYPGSDPLTVSRAELLAYLGTEGWSPRTAHCIRSTFRVFWGLLFELGHRPDDPARTLPHIKVPRSVPRPCPDHAIHAAYESAPTPMLKLALRVAVETGLRRAELAQVRPADVIGAPGRYSLHVVGKGGHERLVPLADDLAEELLAVPTPYVFPAVDQWGNQVAPHISADRLGVLVADALPGQWTAHTLRHRFATVAYEATGDIRAVQDLMGHVSPVTTAIYTKVNDDAMRRAAMAAALRTD